MHTTVPLSQLSASRRNPRRVKPRRQGHRRLVASIRAYGLLEPLIVEHTGDNGTYRVIAGNRRLTALRDVYRGTNPDIPCEVREVDRSTADALSLSENFARQDMHPLDEARVFAKLSDDEAKGVASIAADFGVTTRYVRQRIKLARLAEPVACAYREDRIDTATAEAFAAVPEERQREIWNELDGKPRDVRHVETMIANRWIDSEYALFDVRKLPQSATSRDLFGQRVLIERSAFMDAQADSLIDERHALVEDGWSEVVIANSQDADERLCGLEPAPTEYDKVTSGRLAEIDQRRQETEADLDRVDEDDEKALEAAYERLDALDAEADRAARGATQVYGEAVKANGTALLILDPDGRVRRDYRIARNASGAAGTVRVNGHIRNEPGCGVSVTTPPTSDDLSDRQKATSHTHEALAVREALLADDQTRRVVLALILHENVRKEGLAAGHGKNPTSEHADNTEGFASTALDTLRHWRAEADPVTEAYSVDEAEAYQRLRDVDSQQVKRLIDVLIVEIVTANLHRPTPLVRMLAQDLGVNVRRYWRPEAAWLGSYKKVQLAHLIGELRGPAHGSAAERRKKSELVDELETLFAQAAEGWLDDPQLADRVNTWLPANLKPEAEEAEGQAEAVA